MRWRKPGQVNQEPDNVSSYTEAAQEGAKAARVQLTKRGGAALLSLILLVAVAIAGTVAWYTRVATIEGITMRAARFDVRANYVTSDLVVDASHYLNVSQGKAAPGTTGVIPIRIDSGSSETAVDYTLGLDFSTMAEDFQKHICFYYYTLEENGNNYTKHYMSPGDTSAEAMITGTVQPGSSPVYEFIYWTWVFQLSKALYLDDDRIWREGEESDNFSAEETDAFDVFDTHIGLGDWDDVVELNGKTYTKEINADGNAAEGTTGHLYAYQQAMSVKLNVVGAQAEPTRDDASEHAENHGTSVYYAAPVGSESESGT